MLQRKNSHRRNDESIRETDRVCSQRGDCWASLGLGERTGEGMDLYYVFSVIFNSSDYKIVKCGDYRIPLPSIVHACARTKGRLPWLNRKRINPPKSYYIKQNNGVSITLNYFSWHSRNLSEYTGFYFSWLAWDFHKICFWEVVGLW